VERNNTQEGDPLAAWLIEGTRSSVAIMLMITVRMDVKDEDFMRANECYGWCREYTMIRHFSELNNKERLE